MPFPWTKPHPRTPIEPQSHPPNPFLPIQTHLSAFLSSISSSNPLKTHIDSAFESLGNALQSGLSRLASPSAPLRSPPWARLTPPPLAGDGPAHRFDLAMSTEAIEERLAGVPVYALSNSAEEFVLVAGVGSGKSLGLFCFKKEDAEALLDQMRSMNHDMRQGSKVVALALSKCARTACKGRMISIAMLLFRLIFFLFHLSALFHGVLSLTLAAEEASGNNSDAYSSNFGRSMFCLFLLKVKRWLGTRLDDFGCFLFPLILFLRLKEC
ncbi:protein TIC 22-like, chloroplastic isoform X2 [Elaeis guineensis]|uniref:protein TIC 22-like, chloroplastic isoform X2 n=1 Tax=Elaeis guineensis var. tenera TaxID=51953 RepID=UPI003C6CF1BA